MGDKLKIFDEEDILIYKGMDYLSTNLLPGEKVYDTENKTFGYAINICNYYNAEEGLRREITIQRHVIRNGIIKTEDELLALFGKGDELSKEQQEIWNIKSMYNL